MEIRTAAILAFAAVACAGAQAACYTVYNSKNEVLYQSQEAPVDLSLPVQQTIHQRFGADAALVFRQDASRCDPRGVGVEMGTGQIISGSDSMAEIRMRQTMVNADNIRSKD